MDTMMRALPQRRWAITALVLCVLQVVMHLGFATNPVDPVIAVVYGAAAALLVGARSGAFPLLAGAIALGLLSSVIDLAGDPTLGGSAVEIGVIVLVAAFFMYALPLGAALLDRRSLRRRGLLDPATGQVDLAAVASHRSQTVGNGPWGAPPPPAPAPAPGKEVTPEGVEAQLARIAHLRDAGQLTPEEATVRRESILSRV